VKPQLSGSAITPAQIALLQGGRFMMGELYTFYLANGVVDYFTSLDVPITFNGNTFKANSIRISGLKFKLSVGVDVDEQDIKIAAFPWDTLGGSEFITSVLDGALDGGYVARDRAFWTPTSGIPAVDYKAAPALVVRLSYMRCSTITKGGRTWVEMKLKSPMVLLNIDMPRNPYSPSCLHTLFDTGCTLHKASFGTNGTVGNSSTLISVTWSGGIPVQTGADGYANYEQGRVLFTSGPNANTQFAVAWNDSTSLKLQQPMDVLPNIGDHFTAYVGCSKTLNTCTLKFFNQSNWRGYDLIPPVYTSL
jgi:uncharacterized phage protein (TIGR02218 family)